MSKQRVIIADSNKIFREGLRRILLNIGNSTIVGEAETGHQVITLLDSRPADIVFLEVDLPGMDGYEATCRGRRNHPGTRFIAFSSRENQRYIRRMQAAGVSGYLAKSNDNLELLHAILKGRDQRFFLSPGLSGHLLNKDNHSQVNP